MLAHACIICCLHVCGPFQLLQGIRTIFIPHAEPCTAREVYCFSLNFNMSKLVL